MLSEEIIEKYSTNASGLAKYFSEIYYKEHERKFLLKLNKHNLQTSIKDLYCLPKNSCNKNIY